MLCDVSDSVRNASRMMLLFTYTMQELFTRVRSFVFVSEVGEVTKLFVLPNRDVLIAGSSAAVDFETTAGASAIGPTTKTF